MAGLCVTNVMNMRAFGNLTSLPRMAYAVLVMQWGFGSWLRFYASASTPTSRKTGDPMSKLIMRFIAPKIPHELAVYEPVLDEQKLKKAEATWKQDAEEPLFYVCKKHKQEFIKGGSCPDCEKACWSTESEEERLGREAKLDAYLEECRSRTAKCIKYFQETALKTFAK